MTNKLKILTLTLLISACSTDDCNASEACADVVPTDELCQAYFERWFFNDVSKSCYLAAYSGCSQKGFESKEACEKCKCK